MENNLYAQQYTETMEFLLQLLKNDLENIDSLTSTHEDKINRLPIYISMLYAIEQMRGGFIGSPARPDQSFLDQNHLYNINNQATKLVNDFIIKLASDGIHKDILSAIDNQYSRVKTLLK